MSFENDPRLAQFLQRAERFMERVEASFDLSIVEPDWSASVAMRYRRKRSGQGVLVPVQHIADIRFSDLKEVEVQKERLLRNTQQFVQGRLTL